MNEFFGVQFYNSTAKTAFTPNFISSLGIRSCTSRCRRYAPNIGKFAKALMARKESRIDIGGGSEL